jgi:hypothetical protein
MSAALSAPTGAQASTATPVPRNLAQVICTRLLRTPLDVIADAVGCDISGASRVRSGERACSVQGWLKLTDALGYKLVNKTKLCMEADEARMLRRAYSFISSSDELAARFAASLESVPLEQDFGDE